MRQRRLLGIDLGTKTAHAVVILDEQRRLVARRRCVPTVASLERIEADAMEGLPAGSVLEVVMDIRLVVASPRSSSRHSPQLRRPPPGAGRSPETAASQQDRSQAKNDACINPYY